MAAPVAAHRPGYRARMVRIMARSDQKKYAYRTFCNKRAIGRALEWRRIPARP